ncbi:hypothetical protein MOF7_24390 [Methylobacterium oryzae]
MTQGLDRGTLDRLVALGQARGTLTADDLRAALPVERMDVDALVLVMLELEAAGVSVEPEAFDPPTDRPVPVSITLPNPRPGAAPPVREAQAAPGAAFAAPQHHAPLTMYLGQIQKDGTVKVAGTFKDVDPGEQCPKLQ